MQRRCRWRIGPFREPDGWHKGDQEHATSSADGRSPAFLLWFFLLCHTHAPSWLTDTHTIPFRGRVYVCVVLRLGLDAAVITRHIDPSEILSRLGQCHQANQPRLLQPIIANARPTPGCVQGLLSQTPAFALPKYVLAVQGPHGALHCISVRISVSVLFRFYISFFVSVSVYIVSVRQRTLTNADDR